MGKAKRSPGDTSSVGGSTQTWAVLRRRSASAERRRRVPKRNKQWPNLKPWYQVITPREDLRENRPMDASEFAVHLDHIREGRENVSKDYSEPDRFFERTYLTESLLELCSQVVRRLSGIQVETSAVFNMATQFGGGKTHSLTTLTTSPDTATRPSPGRAWNGSSTKPV